MLSDRERHVLDEVERRLATDHPAFLSGGLRLLAGSVGGALAAVAATGGGRLAGRTCPATGRREQW